METTHLTQAPNHPDFLPAGIWSPAGNPDERYPYGFCPLRYRYIYDVYLRPAGLADSPRRRPASLARASRGAC